VRQAVLTILQRAARKLLLTRALEAAAAAATAGGLSAAAVILAWTIGDALLVLGVAVCALPVGWGGAMLLLPSRSRRALGLGRETAAVIASLSVLAGAAAGALLLSGWYAAVPRGAAAAALLIAFAPAGALGCLVRGVSPLRVARYLDARAGLRERLATAAELALGPTARSASAPAAEAVYAQALAALRSARPQRDPMWRRTRRTAAALALAVLLCGTLLLLPSRPAEDRYGAARLADALGRMSPEDRERLAKAFAAAVQPTTDPEVAANLLGCAQVVRVNDPAELERMLDKLRRAGFRPLSVVPGDLLAAAGIGASGAGDATARKDDAERAAHSGAPPDANRPADPNAESAARAFERGVVRVYDPRYSRVSPPGAAAADANAAARNGRAFRPYSDAWTAARRRSADALASNRVPFEYRPIVRRFFLSEE